MKVITDSLTKDTKVILTIGMFDGVHLGHQEILKNVIEISKNKNLKSGLMTFDPHPRIFFNPESEFKLLSTLDEKIEKLKSIGLDFLIVQKFDDDFRNLSAEEFIRDILIKKYSLDTLIIGHDHQLGKNREGNYSQLNDLSKQYNFNLIQIKEIKSKDTVVSSTKIRTALLDGRIIDANKMLNSLYKISGKVVHGLGLGKKLGFPTANLEIDFHKLIPKNGVYSVNVLFDSRKYLGMMNIGNRPTINAKTLQLEVNIFDFEGDLYGKNIEIEFLDFIREEKKFNTLESLISQIKKDKQQILSIVI